MDSDKKTAIIVGILFITATVTYSIGNQLIGSILNVPDYLITLSANENQVISGAILELIDCGAVIGIAVMMYPILQRYNKALALGYVGARIIEGVLFVMAVIGILSLLTLSHEYTKAGALDISYFQSLGILLIAVRDWAGNVLGLVAFGLGALIFYYLLYRSNLVPRWLSVWGLIGAPLVLAGSISAVFGGGSLSATVSALYIPIAVNEMVLAGWLIVKGFNTSAITAVSAE